MRQTLYSTAEQSRSDNMLKPWTPVHGLVCIPKQSHNVTVLLNAIRNRHTRLTVRLGNGDICFRPNTWFAEMNFSANRFGHCNEMQTSTESNAVCFLPFIDAVTLRLNIF
jgi:hypothetical protein